MKYFILVITILVVASCNSGQSSKKVDTNFKNLMTFFENANPPLSFDSIFFNNSVSMKNKRELQAQFVEMTGILEASERYDGKNKFLLYPVYKLETFNEYVILICFFTLNPDVPFDAQVDRIYLTTYDSDGSLISELIIGLIQKEFGLVKTIYSNLNLDGTIDMRSNEIIKNNTTGEVTKNELNQRIVIDKSGKISTWN